MIWRSRSWRKRVMITRKRKTKIMMKIIRMITMIMIQRKNQ